MKNQLIYRGRTYFKEENEIANIFFNCSRPKTKAALSTARFYLLLHKLIPSFIRNYLEFQVLKYSASFDTIKEKINGR